MDFFLNDLEVVMEIRDARIPSFGETISISI
jgi:hypothetical protein